MFMLGNCSVVLQHYCQVNYGAESGPKRVKLNQKVTFEMETLGFDGAIPPGVAFFPFSVFKSVFRFYSSVSCIFNFFSLFFQFQKFSSLYFFTFSFMGLIWCAHVCVCWGRHCVER